jgi:hypothetical protein
MLFLEDVVGAIEAELAGLRQGDRQRDAVSCPSGMSFLIPSSSIEKLCWKLADVSFARSTVT